MDKEVFVSLWFRAIMLIIPFIFVFFGGHKIQENRLRILGGLIGTIILLCYMIMFIFGSKNYNHTLLLPESPIFRGYIHKKDGEYQDDDFDWMVRDESLLVAVYLILYIILYLPHRVNGVGQRAAKSFIGLLLVVVFAFVLFVVVFASVFYKAHTSVSAISKYIYFGVFSVTAIFSAVIAGWWRDDYDFKTNILIFLGVTLVYLIIAPLINKFIEVECEYYDTAESCPPGACSFVGDSCSAVPVKEDSPTPCSDYSGDEKTQCLENNCYFVEPIPSAYTEVNTSEENKLNELKSCIPKDDKCNNNNNNCESFRPTNLFSKCCYDKIYENCSRDEIQTGLDTNKASLDRLKEENKTTPGRIGPYGQVAGEAQLIYEETQRICEGGNRRQEMEDDIYA